MLCSNSVWETHTDTHILSTVHFVSDDNLTVYTGTVNIYMLRVVFGLQKVRNPTTVPVTARDPMLV